MPIDPYSGQNISEEEWNDLYGGRISRSESDTEAEEIAAALSSAAARRARTIPPHRRTTVQRVPFPSHRQRDEFNSPLPDSLGFYGTPPTAEETDWSFPTGAGVYGTLTTNAPPAPYRPPVFTVPELTEQMTGEQLMNKISSTYAENIELLKAELFKAQQAHNTLVQEIEYYKEQLSAVPERTVTKDTHPHCRVHKEWTPSCKDCLFTYQMESVRFNSYASSDEMLIPAGASYYMRTQFYEPVTPVKLWLENGEHQRLIRFTADETSREIIYGAPGKLFADMNHKNLFELPREYGGRSFSVEVANQSDVATTVRAHVFGIKWTRER